MHKHLKAAFDLTHTCDSNLEFCHAAVIVGGGKVLSTGVNRWVTNSAVEHYTNRIRGPRDYTLVMHAEMDAVFKARAKTDLTGCKIYVARRRKDQPSGRKKNDQGLPGVSRPCPICEEVLRSYGIRRAYYTMDETHYGVMHLTKDGGVKDRIVRIGDLE